MSVPLSGKKMIHIKKLVVDPNRCKGCLTCEIMCSFFHEDVFSTERSRIHVIKDDEAGVDAPIVCRQCSNPVCSVVCPERVISKDPMAGVVSVEEARCSGCGECVQACPFGGMVLHPDTGVAIKCDLCGGNPQCVEHCPHGAIFFAEPSKINRIKRQGLKGQIVERVVQTRWERGQE
jgi:carbon-monoxide dehydrogenase iron sulfur subunit